MSAVEILQAVLLLCGAVFFVTGTVGLMRFPDTYTRLHALAKADNLGLGLIVAGLVPGAESAAAALKLLLIWVLVMVSGSTASHLVARNAHRRGLEPMTGRSR